MAFDEDLTAFIDDDDFAIEVIYTPVGYPHPSSQTRTLSVIFDEEYLAQVGGEIGIIGDQPQALCIAAGVADVQNGQEPLTFLTTQYASLTILGEVYKVTEPQPDGTGLIVLLLEKQ